MDHVPIVTWVKPLFIHHANKHTHTNWSYSSHLCIFQWYPVNLESTVASPNLAWLTHNQLCGIMWVHKRECGLQCLIYDVNQLRFPLPAQLLAQKMKTRSLVDNNILNHQRVLHKFFFQIKWLLRYVDLSMITVPPGPLHFKSDANGASGKQRDYCIWRGRQRQWGSGLESGFGVDTWLLLTVWSTGQQVLTHTHTCTGRADIWLAEILKNKIKASQVRNRHKPEFKEF